MHKINRMTWEWTVADYFGALDRKDHLPPRDAQRGRCLDSIIHRQKLFLVSDKTIACYKSSIGIELA